MCFYLVKRKSGLELTTTTENILLRLLHAKERSVARIPDQDSGLSGVVLEYFGRAGETCGTVSRKVDPYLDTITLPHDVISIEVEGHHLAGVNDLAIESAQDIALAIDKHSTHNNVSIAGVRCR